MVRYMGTRVVWVFTTFFHSLASVPVDSEEDVEVEESEKRAQEEYEAREEEEDDDFDRDVGINATTSQIYASQQRSAEERDRMNIGRRELELGQLQL